MLPGSQDDRIDDLLALWEEKRDQGQTVSAESLCSHCPDLAPELSRRIQALVDMNRVLDHGATTPHNGTGDSEQQVRLSATCQVHYDGLRFHAEGGLGQVFTAEGRDLNRIVALKFIKPSRAGDLASRRRFRFEAKVTARLEHPGVVPVYGVGTDDRGRSCYAMRLIGGKTLQDAIDDFHSADRPDRDRNERADALRKLLRRFVSVCNTVAYAHSRGVLHRDLKPKNVMLGPFDETLVVDWGLAKPFAVERLDETAAEALMDDAEYDHDSVTADVIGSPGYLSPEQRGASPRAPQATSTAWERYFTHY